MKFRFTVMLRDTLLIAGLITTLISCSEDTAAPSRDLGASVTYRLAGGLTPRQLITDIEPTGHVVARTVDAPDRDVWVGRGVLTTAEFDQLDRLLESFSEFESCYCSDEVLLDGPSEMIRVKTGSTVDVHIYGVPRDQLPTKLVDLVSLLSEVRERIRQSQTD